MCAYKTGNVNTYAFRDRIGESSIKNVHSFAKGLKCELCSFRMKVQEQTSGQRLYLFLLHNPPALFPSSMTHPHPHPFSTPSFPLLKIFGVKHRPRIPFNQVAPSAITPTPYCHHCTYIYRNTNEYHPARVEIEICYPGWRDPSLDNLVMLNLPQVLIAPTKQKCSR